MKFFKTLNEKTTQMMTTRFFSFTIVSIVFLLAFSNLKAQRNSGTIDFEDLTILNAEDGTLITTDLNTTDLPTHTTNGGAVILPKISLDVTDVIPITL